MDTEEQVVEGYTLNGKTALVTGIEHPVPYATALVLAAAGADVAVMTGQDSPAARERALAASAAIQQQQRRGLVSHVDVTNALAVQAAVDACVGAWGHLDILINGLDAPYAGAFLDNHAAAWQRLSAQVLQGTMQCIQAAGRHMVARQHGRVVTYVSVLAERGVAHCAAYGAIQAALLQLTRGLAVEWGRQGVTVNAIGHGWMEPSPFLPAAADEFDRLVRYIPNHRLGQADDLAALTVYLASESGGNVTGQVMYLEGGVLAHP